MTNTHAPPSATGAQRTRLVWETAIVLSLTLGKSAIYSMLSLIRVSTQDGGLREHTAALNPQRAEAMVWDITYRLLNIAFDLCLVALVVYLLWEPGTNALRRMGLDGSRMGSDAARGTLLVAVIGVPGIGLYVLGREFGATVEVQAAPLDGAWWTIPFLVLSAVRAGLLEEVLFYGYFARRLAQLGWSPWTIIISTALLRGAYHAYQGIGPIIGNIAMGVLFGWLFLRWQRVMPFVIAHTLIDTAAFIGYPLAAPYLP